MRKKEVEQVIAYTVLEGYYQPRLRLGQGRIMTFEDALKLASRDERFMATIYAMNSLLIHKGVYSAEEFESLFVEWMGKEQRKKVHPISVSSKSLCEA